MKDMNNPLEDSEFSRVFQISDLLDGDLPIEISATEDECAALARRFDLRAIEEFSATARLAPMAAGLLRLTLTFRARITQTCVVSLEPFESVIEETVERRFAPPGVSLAPPGEAVEIVVVGEDGDGGEDPPEPLADETIDLGEIAAEHLGLAVDPHPKRPGIVFESVATQGFSEPEPRKSPFAVLASARRGR